MVSPSGPRYLASREVPVQALAPGPPATAAVSRTTSSDSLDQKAAVTSPTLRSPTPNSQNQLNGSKEPMVRARCEGCSAPCHFQKLSSAIALPREGMRCQRCHVRYLVGRSRFFCETLRKVDRCCTLTYHVPFKPPSKMILKSPGAQLRTPLN